MKSRTVTYRGRRYGHQQIWALVNDLRANEWTVCLRGVPGDGQCWVAQLNYNVDGSGGSRVGETPWIAICRNVEEIVPVCENPNEQ